MENYSTAEEYETRQSDIRSRLQEMNEAAAGQRMSEEAAAEWNALNEEFDSNILVIRELQAREARIESLSNTPSSLESTNPVPSDRVSDVWDMAAVRNTSRSPEHEVQLLRDNAMRALERATFPHESAKREQVQEHIERLMDSDVHGEVSRRVLSTGSPAYKRAFAKALAGKEMTCTTEERTALGIASGGIGGFAIPFYLDPTIIPTSNMGINPFRDICEVHTITGSNTWEGVSSAGVTAAYGSEGAEQTDGSPTFVQPSATVQMASAFVPFSIQVEQDFVGLQAALAKMFQRAKDNLEADKFVNGTGTAPVPVGILGVQGLSTAVKVASITTAAFAVGDVYNVETGLDAAYRGNATFVGNRAVYNAIRQFDTAGGASLFVNNLQIGLPTTPGGNLGARLLGYDTRESTAMAATPATTAAKTLLFGDFENGFAIIDRVGMNVEVMPMLTGASNRYPTLQRGVVAYWRNATCITNSAAFVYLGIK